MRAFIFSLVSAGLTLAAHAAQEWTVVDLGTLGGSMSYGAAVSENGYVVGCSETSTGGIHAFIYQDGAMRDLEPGSGSASSCALAVNNGGVAAGRSATGELVVWNGASVTRLGVQGDVGGINEKNVVVGTYKSGDANRAFIYANGALSDLGSLGGTYTTAAGINERNQVCGSSNGRAFLYDGGTMRDLGTLGGGGASAKGINDRGEVVGMASTGNAYPAPFIYDGAIHAVPSGPSYSAAVAINNRGQVVGSGEGIHGYLIDSNGYARLDTMTAVTLKGWRHMEPTGINDRGWIVGTGVNANGDTHAFLLVPAEGSQNPNSRTLRDFSLIHRH